MSELTFQAILFLVNYLKSQEAYLLSTGNFTGYEEGLNVNIALTHDYFTVALSVGSHLKYYDAKSGEMDEEILHAHPGKDSFLITIKCLLMDATSAK